MTAQSDDGTDAASLANRRRTESAYRRGLLFVIIATALWSLGGLFASLVSVDTLTTLFWRGVFGALSLFTVLLLFDRKRLLDVARLGWGGWLYAITSAASMFFYLSSIGHTSIAQNSIIWALVPLITALAAWVVLRERITLSALIASLIAFGGIVVMLVGAPGEGSLFGNVLAVLMMLCGVGMILTTRLYAGIPAIAASLMASILAALLAFPLAKPETVTPTDLMVLCVFGISQGALGMVLFAKGSPYVPAAQSALISALEGPLGPVWVFLVLGVVPLPATVLGGTIVLAAVVGHVLVASRGRR